MSVPSLSLEGKVAIVTGAAGLRGIAGEGRLLMPPKRSGMRLWQLGSRATTFAPGQLAKE